MWHEVKVSVDEKGRSAGKRAAALQLSGQSAGSGQSGQSRFGSNLGAVATPRTGAAFAPAYSTIARAGSEIAPTPTTLVDRLLFAALSGCADDFEEIEGEGLGESQAHRHVDPLKRVNPLLWSFHKSDNSSEKSFAEKNFCKLKKRSVPLCDADWSTPWSKMIVMGAEAERRGEFASLEDETNVLPVSADSKVSFLSRVFYDHLNRFLIFAPAVLVIRCCPSWSSARYPPSGTRGALFLSGPS